MRLISYDFRLNSLIIQYWNITFANLWSDVTKKTFAVNLDIFSLTIFLQMKLGALKFLARDLFEPSDVICHFVAATGDTRHR